MPNAQLATPDLIIVALYVLAMTGLGVWFTKKQKDLRAYFVGGRDVGWFMVLVSIVATETSAVTFLSVPGLAYKDGGNLTFLQLALGYILGRTAVAFLLLPGYMRGDIFSAYQVLREQFGPGVQRVASGLFLITRTIADGLRLFLTALVMQYIGLTVPQAVWAVAVVTVIYTYLGGMKAVLWTDLIQFVIKIAGAALAFGFVLHLLPGGWEQFTAEANELINLLSSTGLNPGLPTRRSGPGSSAGPFSAWRRTARINSWSNVISVRAISHTPRRHSFFRALPYSCSSYYSCFSEQGCTFCATMACSKRGMPSRMKPSDYLS
jgi:Na+/proline symporter